MTTINPMKIMLLCIVTIWLLAFQGLAFAENPLVTVTGRGVTRQDAVRDAMRLAVEKGIGVWINSTTEVKNATVDKDKILSHAEGYVTDSNVLQESQENGLYVIVLQARVSVDQIGVDLKKLITNARVAMGNPRIAFVLATYRFDQKFSDTTIIDSFTQEFSELRFKLVAADKAAEIALAPASQLGLNIKDRKAVRDAAEKENANYVARGEVNVLDQHPSASGNNQTTVQINTEIIDVNSGDVVAAYSNTVSAVDPVDIVAQKQAIKKASVLASRELAKQTLANWQESSNNGRSYTIELRNVRSMRTQKIPFQQAVRSIVSEITSETAPNDGVITLHILYKGSKDELGEEILKFLNNTPGFSQKEFDGPGDEGGKIIFTFTL